MSQRALGLVLGVVFDAVLADPRRWHPSPDSVPLRQPWSGSRTAIPGVLACCTSRCSWAAQRCSVSGNALSC